MTKENQPYSRDVKDASKITSNQSNINSESKNRISHKIDKKVLARIRRGETLRKMRGEAFEVLKTLVGELATHGEEMKDTQSYQVELLDNISPKNHFWVEGDLSESVVKAMNFLLQRDSLSDIAKVLIPNQSDFKDGVEMSRTSLISLMREKNPSRFQFNKKN